MNYKNLAKSILTLQIIKQLTNIKKSKKHLKRLETDINKNTNRLLQARTSQNLRSIDSLCNRLNRLDNEFMITRSYCEALKTFETLA